MTYEWHRAEIAVDGPVNPVRVVDDPAVRCLTEYGIVPRPVDLLM